VNVAAKKGYLMIILMLAVFAISIGLLVALPVWQTDVRREKEEELIFRGKQYVEAVRLYVLKNPGRFPSSLKELLDKKCIRKLYRDPMTESGEWNVILNPGTPAGGPPTAGPQIRGGAEQEVLLVPEKALSSIRSAIVLGVASPSTRPSIKIYNDQETYDKWLFFYGQDPKKLPKITRYGEKGKTP
jgi:type II secretory pathway pseudopilin PulG